MFDCDQCGKSYNWRDSLTRHMKKAHGQTPTKKRKHAAEKVSDAESYSPLKRTNEDDWNPNKAEPGFFKEEPLQHRGGVPVTTANKRDLLSRQASTSIAESFKFKHPFGMLVAGPTQSGKTQWTVKFLKERHQHIDTPVDGILFCYSEWQANYDTLKREVPNTQFHKGIPSLDTLKSLQNVILVIDDLMEVITEILAYCF